MNTYYLNPTSGLESPDPQTTARPNGPAPCFGAPGTNITYPSIADLAQKAGKSWRVYSWGLCSNILGLDVNSTIRYSKQWPSGFPMQKCHEDYGPINTGTIDTPNFRTPSNVFLTDESPGKKPLANVTWILPGPYNSDHPGIPGGFCGPTWVASIINAHTPRLYGADVEQRIG